MRAMSAMRRCRPFVSAALTLAIVATSSGANAAFTDSPMTPAPAHPEAQDAPRFASFVTEAAHRFGLPEAWIWAVIRVESGGDPNVVSPAGAMGLMQLMPATWALERARLTLGADPYDSRDNILAGTDYLRALHARYGEIGMLAAYNAGPGRYEDYRHGDRPLPTETVAYVRRLAPVVTGGMVIDEPAIAPPDPLAWTRASLFTAPSISPRAAHSSATEVPSSTPSLTDEVAVRTAKPVPANRAEIVADLHADGLFVVRSGTVS